MKNKFSALFIVASFYGFAQSPGGVSAGLQTWLRADIGTTGNPVSAWTNQAPGTATNIQGLPSRNTASTSYNYNPFIDFLAPAFTLPNAVHPQRQCILLNGFTDINGINYSALFFTFHQTDLTREYTHLATVSGITGSAPANGTLSGDGPGVSIVNWGVYDPADFGAGAPASTWQRNGTNIPFGSNHLNQKHILSAVSQTGGTTTLNAFLGGQNDNGGGFNAHPRDWRGPAAEIIGYTSALTAIERRRIHSYLAIKYGETLPTNYLSTSGTAIYTTTTPYINNIIGIGRDDVELLNQKQSHYNNDQVRIYLNTLAATNVANVGVFSTNISYVLMGDNNGAHCATAASNSEIPTGLTNCALYSRLEKEWKVTRTNNASTYNMDVRLAGCGAPGSVNVADLRLLVDNDGDFGNGGTQCYYIGDGTGISFSYTNPVITVSGISTTHIPDNGSRFVTIASVNQITPLPVELTYFKAKLNSENTQVDLTWQTERELISRNFSVEKSTDYLNWEKIIDISAAINSEIPLNYSDVDPFPSIGMNYYKLTLFDQNGDISFSEIKAVTLEIGNELIAYPNPTNGSFSIVGSNLDDSQFNLVDALGKNVLFQYEIVSSSHAEFNMGNISSGAYFLYIKNNMEVKVLKIQRN